MKTPAKNAGKDSKTRRPKSNVVPFPVTPKAHPVFPSAERWHHLTALIQSPEALRKIVVESTFTGYPAWLLIEALAMDGLQRFLDGERVWGENDEPLDFGNLVRFTA